MSFPGIKIILTSNSQTESDKIQFQKKKKKALQRTTNQIYPYFLFPPLLWETACLLEALSALELHLGTPDSAKHQKKKKKTMSSNPCTHRNRKRIRDFQTPSRRRTLISSRIQIPYQYGDDMAGSNCYQVLLRPHNGIRVRWRSDERSRLETRRHWRAHVCVCVREREREQNISQIGREGWMEV